MRKLPIIIIAMLLLSLGTCAYFVGGISATYPPIRIYTFNGSVNQLGKGIKNLSSIDNRVNIKVSRRDSSTSDAGFRDIVVVLKRDSATIEYSLVCEPAGNKNKSTIKLIMVYDRTNNIGGYRIKAPGVKKLVSYFEKKFLMELRQKQSLVLQPDTSFWDNFSIY